MRKQLVYISVFALLALKTEAQQITLFDHYLVQPFLVNPAAAGLNGTSIFLDYRRQWAGFTGAPETQVLAVDGVVNREKMGVGLTIMNDQVNVLGNTSAMATYAYRVKFDDDHQLRFGLSGGLVQNRIIFSRIIAEDPSELQIFQNNQNGVAFDGSAGIHYVLKNFQAGFAATHLFGGRFYYEDNFQSNSLHFQNIRHYLGNAQYRFDIKEGRFGIMPAVQVRSVQGMKFFYEGGLTAFYKKEGWLTLRYSHLSGCSAGVGGVISKNIVAGYSYSFAITGIKSYNQGTHDVIIGFRIPSGKKGMGGMDEKELEELKRKNNELFEKTDYLKNENEALRKELEDQKKVLKESIYGLDSLKKHMMLNKDELEKLIRENQEKMNSLPGDGSTGTKLDPGQSASTDKDGINKTVEGKVYVVIGAVRTLENAKLLQKIAMREYNETTYVVRDDAEYWYFVYTKSFDNKADAVDERDRADKVDTKSIYIGDPWFYVSKKK